LWCIPNRGDRAYAFDCTTRVLIAKEYIVRVLIVEDDPLVAVIAAGALADAGHEVVGPAYDAEEAWRLVRDSPPDLALVDINLSGRDEGLALAQRFKDDLGLPSMFVSGEVAAARRRRSSALGVLAKPYDPGLLVEAVEVARSILQGRGPPARRLPPALELFAS
jgi:CheY-like chemotaxis protein